MRLTDVLARRRAPAVPGAPAPEAVPEPHGDGGQDHQVTIRLDYPVHPRTRYGWGQPSHPELKELFAAHEQHYAEHLRAFGALFDRMAAITVAAPDDPEQPHWANDFIPGLDGVALYGFAALTQPATYLEVGSGNSTKFVKRAVRDLGTATTVVSIDPQPRAEVDAICDEVIRQPVEDVDLAIFDRLASGDMLFIDNSHRSFQNSDATVVLTEVLPRLRPGVLVGIHDIFLPDDYPPEWNDRYYSEQYLLATFLLGGHRGYEIELPAWYAANRPSLNTLVLPLFERPGMESVQRHGGAMWLRRTDEPR